MFGHAPLAGLGTRAVGPTLAALLLASPLVAQSIFERISPFTSACYTDQDTYDEELEALKATLQAELYAAEDTNGTLTRSVDFAQQQQGLVAAMQANPQRAMEIMQRQQTLPMEVSEFEMASAERESAFEAEVSALVDEYRQTLAARTSEIDARIGELSNPGANGPANYMEVLEGLYAQWDTEYAAHCGEWFGPSGRFGVFLGGVRSYLLDEWIPQRRAFTEAGNEALQFMGGVDTSTYVYTEEHEAAIRYIDRALVFLYNAREPTTRDATRGAI